MGTAITMRWHGTNTVYNFDQQYKILIRIILNRNNFNFYHVTLLDQLMGYFINGAQSIFCSIAHVPDLFECAWAFRRDFVNFFCALNIA